MPKWQPAEYRFECRSRSSHRHVLQMLVYVGQAGAKVPTKKKKHPKEQVGTKLRRVVRCKNDCWLPSIQPWLFVGGAVRAVAWLPADAFASTPGHKFTPFRTSISVRLPQPRSESLRAEVRHTSAPSLDSRGTPEMAGARSQNDCSCDFAACGGFRDRRLEPQSPTCGGRSHPSSETQPANLHESHRTGALGRTAGRSQKTLGMA